MQKYVQMILVVVAVLCVPWMLLTRPLILRSRMKKQAGRTCACALTLLPCFLEPIAAAHILPPSFLPFLFFSPFFSLLLLCLPPNKTPPAPLTPPVASNKKRFSARDPCRTKMRSSSTPTRTAATMRWERAELWGSCTRETTSQPKTEGQGPASAGQRGRGATRVG